MLGLALSITPLEASASASASGNLSLAIKLIDLDLSDGITPAISFTPAGAGTMFDDSGNFTSYSFAAKVVISIWEPNASLAHVQRDYDQTLFSNLTATKSWGSGSTGTATATALTSSSTSINLSALSGEEGVRVDSKYQVLSDFALTASTAIEVTAVLSGVALQGNPDTSYLGANLSLSEQGSLDDFSGSVEASASGQTASAIVRLANTSNTSLNGNFQVFAMASVSSVPEVQSGWMLLAGLGALGVMTRRRRNA